MHRYLIYRPTLHIYIDWNLGEELFIISFLILLAKRCIFALRILLISAPLWSYEIENPTTSRYVHVVLRVEISMGSLFVSCVRKVTEGRAIYCNYRQLSPAVNAFLKIGKGRASIHHPCIGSEFQTSVTSLETFLAAPKLSPAPSPTNHASLTAWEAEKVEPLQPK